MREQKETRTASEAELQKIRDMLAIAADRVFALQQTAEEHLGATREGSQAEHNLTRAIAGLNEAMEYIYAASETLDRING